MKLHTPRLDTLNKFINIFKEMSIFDKEKWSGRKTRSMEKKAFFSIATVLLIGMTSLLVKAETFVYWTETKGREIARSTDVPGATKENLRSGGSTPSHIAVHPDGRIFWTDYGDINVLGDESIRSANADGSGEVIIYSGSAAVRTIHQPTAIKLDTSDTANEKMYWTDAGWLAQGIHRANLDGSSHEWLIKTQLLRNNYGTSAGQNLEFAQVWGLALDPQNGVMYWSDYFNRDIHVADLVGTSAMITASVRQIVSGLPGIRGMDIDPGDTGLWNGTLYWVTSYAGDVMRASLGGSDPRVPGSLQLDFQAIVNKNLGFGTDLSRPMDIVYENGRIYWTDNNSGFIYGAISDGTGVYDIQELTYERTDKPGRFKNFEPLGIAVLTTGTGTTDPGTGTSTTDPGTGTSTTQVVYQLPSTPVVEYRADKGEWRFFSAASTTAGVPTLYDVIIYNVGDPNLKMILSPNQATNSIGAMKTKGMTLASQGLPENAIYMAVSVTVGGVESAHRPVSMR